MTADVCPQPADLAQIPWLVIDQFEQAWQAGARPEIDDFLLRIDPAQRASELPRLVAIDLEHRLQAGESSVRIEDYLDRYRERYPQLCDPDCLLDLAVGEFLSRQRFGAVDRVNFAARFPQLGDALQEQLKLIPAPPPRPPDMRMRIDRYRLIRLLRCGRMGSVYLAQDEVLPRFVAIKFHHSPQETLAARVQHPVVCPIFDSGQIDGWSYLVMAYIENARSLTRAFPPPVPPERAVELIAGIARAVHAVHEAGVLHRDLKPDNILVDRHNHPLVCDFGLARLLRGDQGTEPEAMIVGTPAYMAPEQARGEPVGRGSDVYSLGVILFELLTEQLPFTGTQSEVISSVASQGNRLRPLIRTAGLDDGLAAILGRATAYQPTERYSSMDEFAGALERWSKPAPPAPSLPARADVSIMELLQMLRDSPGWDEGIRRIRARVEAEPDPARRATLRAGVSWLLRERGQPEEETPPWQAAATGPLVGWGWACQALSALRQRDFAAVTCCLERAAEQAGGERPLQAAIAHLRGTAAYHQGFLPRAWENLCQALEAFGPEHFGTGRVLDTLGMVAATRCQWPAAREFYASALALKTEFGDEAGQALTYGQLGRFELDLGNLDAAESHFRQGLALCRRTGDVRGLAQQTSHQGQVLLAREQPKSALARLDEALALIPAGQWTTVEGYARKDRARALLELGRLAEANQECDRAEALFSKPAFPEGQAHVQHVRGLCLARMGRVGEAEELLQQAVEHFEKDGEAGEQARCLWSLAGILREVPCRQAKADQTCAAAWSRAGRSRRPHLMAAIEQEWGSTGAWRIDEPRDLPPFAAETVQGTVLAATLDPSVPLGEDGLVEWEWRSHLLADLEAELCTKQWRGEVVEVSRDGFIALFRQYGHGRQALRAALDVVGWLRAFNRPRAVMDWPIWQARLGLASGTVWLGRTGQLARVERTAGGPAIRQALALRASALPDVPCCDDAVRAGGFGMTFRPHPGTPAWEVLA